MSLRGWLLRLLGAEPAHAPGPDWMPVFLPDGNPLEDSDASESARRNTALRIVDDDCYGYLLVTLHRDSVDDDIAHVELAQDIAPEWWPAVKVTLERILVVLGHES